MSLAPDKVPASFDLFEGSGATTGTQTGRAFIFPPGKKAVQVSLVTSATLTVKIQNSVDKNTWFDVSSSTVAPGYLAEVDSVVPWWRVNVTAHTTSGTGASAPIVAVMSQLLL